MGITLDTPGTGGPPALKFGDVGSYATLGIVNVEEGQSRNYDTGDPEFWDAGKPKMHPRITAIVVDHAGASVGKDDEERPVEVGELVSLYVQGSRIYTWREAKKEHGAVEVGDVMRWTFDRTDAPRNPRFKGNPVKVFVAKLRKPASKDGDLLERCEAAYYQLRDRVALEPAGAPAPGPSYGDEEPFLRLGDRDFIHRDLHLEV